MLTNLSFCTNTDQTFTFHIDEDSIEKDYYLDVSITKSLYEYYKKQSHTTYGIKNFSRFVTPNLFSSMAESIRNLTSSLSNSDETFANIVLDIVHQIPYNKSSVKFPIETLVDYYGDCDSLSVLAASIMKAGKLDVVLLYYEDSTVNHMNVGVYLPNISINNIDESNPVFYKYEGKKYFIAETTGKGWKVGDQPKNYANSEPMIISINKSEELKIGNISSSLNSPLLVSDTSLSLMPESLNYESSGPIIQFSGSIFPKIPNQEILIKIEHESKADTVFELAKTNKFGNYNLSMTFNSLGKYTVQSTWMGYQNYSGSDSQKIIVNIGMNHLLDQYELIEIINVGSEFIQIPTLDPVGNRILGTQPIKTIFEEDIIGNEALINAEFFILGNDESYLSEHNLTIPSFEERIIINKEVITRVVPEQTIVIPNYRKRMHSNLEMIYFQNIEKNSFKVRLLVDNDVQEIAEKSEYVLINASSLIEENVLYKTTIRRVYDKIIFELFDDNGFYFSETANIEPTNESGIRIIIEYEPDSIIIINNFQAEILEQPTSHFFYNYKLPFQVTDDQNEETEVTVMPELSTVDFDEPSKQNQKNKFFWLTKFFGMAFIAINLLALFVLITKKKITKTRNKQRQDHFNSVLKGLKS